MGFYLGQHEFESELKQHINLSEAAWLIIYEDIGEFDSGKTSFAGFLNRIFLNFYQKAKASISFRLLEKKNELSRVLASPKLGKLTSAERDLVMAQMIEAHKAALIAQATAYPKGHGDKFRIGKKMLQLLKDSSEQSYYDNSIGLYLKAIYEEYASLRRYEREAIYFKDTIDVVQSAMRNGWKLKIVQKEKSNVAETAKYANQFYVAPHRIVQDTTQSFNYILGYVQRIDGRTDLAETLDTRLGNASTLRISRIDRIAEMTSMGGHISAENKDKLEKMLSERTAAYMATGPKDIVVRFSKKGIDSFHNQIYMRPMSFTIGDKNPDESVEIRFHCSEIQAMNYLFKVGLEIEVLSPASLREKFIERYRDALKVYQRDAA